MKVETNLKAGISFPDHCSIPDNDLLSPSKENIVPPRVMGICIPTDSHTFPLNDCIVT
jgi:hypothetical protein